MDTRIGLRAALGIALLAAATVADAQTAKGTVAQSGKSATMKYAWLVVGPDRIDPKVTRRMLILSADDIGAKVAACKTMTCTTNDLRNGMTVNLGAAPPLEFWVVLNDQRVQYSGVEMPSALKATTNDAKRLAGRLAIDKTSSGGPKLDVEFDAPVVKTFTAP